MIIFPSSLSAELSEAQLEIIRIAYMNGYANAIQNDLETIMVLKKDQEKLKKYAQAAVKDYLEKVSALNQDGTIARKKGKKTASSSEPLSL